MNRRQLLQICSGLGLSGISGCLADNLQDSDQSTVQTKHRQIKSIPEYDASQHPIVADVVQLEMLTHEETNKSREEHSRGRISYDSDLADIARLHSRDMAMRDFYAHENPNGERNQQRLHNYGYYSSTVYENIISTDSVSSDTSLQDMAKMAVDSWLNSPPHREALLREHVTEEGIGVYVTAEPQIYWTVELSKYDVDRQTPTQ